MTEITIYTDGSCQTHAHSCARVGGWAAVLSCGEHRKALSGSAAETTVNLWQRGFRGEGLIRQQGLAQLTQPEFADLCARFVDV